MNVGNLGTLLGNAAFALEQLAWVLEAVVGVLARAHDPVVAQVTVPAVPLQGLGVDLLAAGVFHL